MKQLFCWFQAPLSIGGCPAHIMNEKCKKSTYTASATITASSGD